MSTNIIEFELYKGKVQGKFYPDSHAYWINGKRKTGVTTFIGIKDKSRALVPWATELAESSLVEDIQAGKIISVTDVYTACGLHAVRMKEACDIGTEIHDWVENYIRHKLKEKGYSMPEMPDKKEAQIGVAAFLDWEREHRVKFISSERVVYSKKHDFIGTFDIEATIGKKLYLIDLKSSNGLYNTVNMQTAAYVKADEEESGKKYDGRWALRVSKQTEEEYNTKWEKKNNKRAIIGKDPLPVPPYQVFEAKFLDEEQDSMDNDYKAFLAAKHLYEWDKKTDYYYNK